MEELAHKLPHQAESGIAGESAESVRIRIDLSYDGSGFSGWAAQPGRRTVESVLAETLGHVLRLGAVPRLTVAGRTDAGVHARGQVAHADLPEDAWAAVAARRCGGWPGRCRP